MNNDVYEKVKAIIVELFEKDPEEVTREKLLMEDLELDSLDMFDFACELEKEYDFNFEKDMGPSIGTVGDIVGQLEKHLSK